MSGVHSFLTCLFSRRGGVLPSPTVGFEVDVLDGLGGLVINVVTLAGSVVDSYPHTELQDPT